MCVDSSGLCVSDSCPVFCRVHSLISSDSYSRCLLPATSLANQGCADTRIVSIVSMIPSNGIFALRRTGGPVMLVQNWIVSGITHDTNIHECNDPFISTLEYHPASLS